MLNFSKLLYGVNFKDTFLGHVGCVVPSSKSNFFLILTLLKYLSLLNNSDNSVTALFSLSLC